MCKYCKNDYFDNKNLINKKINLGYLGNLRVEINLGSSDEDGVGRFNTVVWHENGCTGEPIGDFRLNIKYCPMCGMELKGVTNE